MNVRTWVRSFLEEHKEVALAFVIGSVAAIALTSYTITETHVVADLAGIISIRIGLDSSTPVPRYTVVFLLGWGVKSLVSLGVLLGFSFSSSVKAGGSEDD